MTHWLLASVAPSDRCSAGRVTLTTVPSMNAMLEASMVVARIQGAALFAHGRAARAAGSVSWPHGSDDTVDIYLQSTQHVEISRTAGRDVVHGMDGMDDSSDLAAQILHEVSACRLIGDYAP